MIELVFTGMCKDCNQCDLEVDRIDTFCGDAEYIVRCSHEDACVRIRDLQEDEG